MSEQTQSGGNPAIGAEFIFKMKQVVKDKGMPLGTILAGKDAKLAKAKDENRGGSFKNLADLYSELNPVNMQNRLVLSYCYKIYGRNV